MFGHPLVNVPMVQQLSKAIRVSSMKSFCLQERRGAKVRKEQDRDDRRNKKAVKEERTRERVLFFHRVCWHRRLLTYNRSWFLS